MQQTHAAAAALACDLPCRAPTQASLCSRAPADERHLKLPPAELAAWVGRVLGWEWGAEEAAGAAWQRLATFGTE